MAEMERRSLQKIMKSLLWHFRDIGHLMDYSFMKEISFLKSIEMALLSLFMVPGIVLQNPNVGTKSFLFLLTELYPAEKQKLLLMDSLVNPVPLPLPVMLSIGLVG